MIDFAYKLAYLRPMEFENDQVSSEIKDLKNYKYELVFKS